MLKLGNESHQNIDQGGTLQCNNIERYRKIADK